MSTTARVAVVATVGLVGAFLAFIGIGNGHGVPAAHSTRIEPDDPGIWLLHCHINDHIAAGMSTRYQIVS